MKPQGKGKYFWPNGNTFEGEYFAGKTNGLGKHTWKDGSYETGNYVNGKENGPFLYYVQFQGLSASI